MRTEISDVIKSVGSLKQGWQTPDMVVRSARSATQEGNGNGNGSNSGHNCSHVNNGGNPNCGLGSGSGA